MHAHECLVTKTYSGQSSPLDSALSFVCAANCFNWTSSAIDTLRGEGFPAPAVLCFAFWNSTTVSFSGISTDSTCLIRRWGTSPALFTFRTVSRSIKLSLTSEYSSLDLPALVRSSNNLLNLPWRSDAK